MFSSKSKNVNSNGYEREALLGAEASVNSTYDDLPASVADSEKVYNAARLHAHVWCLGTINTSIVCEDGPLCVLVVVHIIHIPSSVHE